MSNGQAFPIVNNWAKGCYLAKVTGSHPKYWFDREFVSGSPVKSRRTLEYLPGRDLEVDPAGWYVMRDKSGATSLLLVTEIGWADMGADLTSEDILAVFDHGLPGVDPDAWAGDSCDCGGLVFPESGCGSCAERALNAAAGSDHEAPF